MSNSVAGSLFHHCLAKTEDSEEGFDDQLLLALGDGDTRCPAEVVEWRAQAGVCGLTNAWR